MDIQLKRAIVDYIFDNKDYFNLQNQTTDHFKAYIYDAKGEHLIGGERVYDFIGQALKLVNA